MPMNVLMTPPTHKIRQH